MLAYHGASVQNTVIIEPGIIHAHQFLQTTLRENTDAISKRALSLDKKELVIKQVTRIATVDQEASHTTINRFCSQQDFVLLLNLGPADRHYYTRTHHIVLKPGGLLLVGPSVDVFYGKAMLNVVFATDEEQSRTQDEGVVLLYDSFFEK